MLNLLIHLIQLPKEILLLLKAEVDHLDINKLINAPNSFKNLKTKGDDLDEKNNKLNITYIYIQATTFNYLNKKINNLENKIPDVTISIHINQYNTDKQSL